VRVAFRSFVLSSGCGGSASSPSLWAAPRALRDGVDGGESARCNGCSLFVGITLSRIPLRALTPFRGGG
jgi:hypothetical protein